MKVEAASLLASSADTREEVDVEDGGVGKGGGASGSGGGRNFKGSTQQWTLQEDNQLRKLVDEHGHRKWSFIASKMNGRRGKQCRDRWLNHLKPDIRRGEWTAEEERILVEGHRMLGTRWAALAKLLPGRPENAIKNHWHATLRCKWAQRGGKISELQAYQHSLQLTNGGGGPAAAGGPIVPSAAASAAAAVAAAGAAATKGQKFNVGAFDFDGAAAAAAVAAAAAAVVGRGGAGTGGTQAIARALDTLVHGAAGFRSKANGDSTGTVGTAAAGHQAGTAKALSEKGTMAMNGAANTVAAAAEAEEEAFATMLGGMAKDNSTAAAAAAALLEANGLAGLAGLASGIDGGAPKAPVEAPGVELVGDSQQRTGGDKKSGSNNSGDIIEAIEEPLDLNRYMSSVRSNNNGGAELASLISSVDKNQGGFPLLGESLAAHGSLVEAALHQICAAIRQKWKVARIALVVRLGVVEEGELSVVVAISANRWREAIDAAQFASIEIKDKLAASIAPQCLGKETKTAAALEAVAAAAGKTTADIMAGMAGGVGVITDVAEPKGTATPEEHGGALKV